MMAIRPWKTSSPPITTISKPAKPIQPVQRPLSIPASFACFPPFHSRRGTDSLSRRTGVSRLVVGLAPGLESVAQVAQEPAGECAVDQAMVVREREVHDRPH